MTQLSLAGGHSPEGFGLPDDFQGTYPSDKERVQKAHHQYLLLGFIPSIRPLSSTNVVFVPFEHQTEPSSSVVREVDIDIDILKTLYAFRNEQLIIEFIRRHASLTWTIFEAYPEIENRFGPNPQICLQIMVDPETPEYEQLFAFIRTELNAEEAFGALSSFEEDWWLMHPSFETGLVCFNIECI